MKSKYWLYIFITIPVTIALIQIYFHTTSDLVSWRGGGFGMYSDPHVNSSRFAWIVGVKNNKKLAVRLSPIDTRLDNKNCGASDFYYDSIEFDDITWAYLNFPSNKSLEPLKDYYEWYIKEYENQTIVEDVFPNDSLRFVVMQQAIAPDFEYIESVELTNLPLE